MNEEPDVSISGWVRNGNESLCESDRNINGAMIGKFHTNEMAQKEIQKKYRSFLQKKDYSRRKSLFNYPIANVLSDENSVLLRNFKSIDLNSKLELIQNIENSLGTLNKGYKVGFVVKDKQLKENQMMQKSAEYHLKNFDFPKSNVNNPFVQNIPAHVHQQFVHTNLKQKHVIDQFVNYIQTLIAPNSMSSKFNKIIFDHKGLIKNKTNRIGFDRLIEQMEKDRKKFCEMFVKDGKSLNEIIQELYKQSIKKQNLDKNIDNNFLKKVQKKQKPDNKDDLYEQLENELKLQGMKMKNKMSPSQSTNTDPFQTIQTQTALESKKTKDDKNSLDRKESIIEPWQAGSLQYEKQSSKVDGKKEKMIDEYKIDSLIQCAVKEDSQNKIYQIYQTKNEKIDSQNNKDIQLEYDKSSYRKLGTAMGTDKSKIQTSLLSEPDKKSPKTPKSPNISCNNIQNPQTQIIVNSNKIIKQDQNNEQKSSDTTLQTQLKLTFKHVQSFNKIPDIIKNSLIHKKKKKKQVHGQQQNEMNSNTESIEKKKLKRIFLNNNQSKQKQDIIEELLKQEQTIKDSSNEKIYQQEITEDVQYDDIQDQIKYFSESNDIVKPKRSVQRAGSYINNTNFQFENVAIQVFRQRQNTEEMFLQQNYLRHQLKKPSTPIMAKRLQNSRVSIGRKRQTIQHNVNDPISLGQIHLVGQNVQQFDQKQFQLLNMEYMGNNQQRNIMIGHHQNEVLSYQFSSSSGNETAHGKIQRQYKLQSLQNLQDNKASNQQELKNQNLLQVSGQQFPMKIDNINGLVKWQPVELINHSLSVENRLKQEQLRQMIMNQHQIVQRQNQQSQNRLSQKQNVSPMSGKEQNKCVQLSVKIDPIQSIQKESSMEYIKTTKGHRPSNEYLEGHYNIKIQDDLETNQTNRRTQNYTELNRRELTNEINEEECNSEYRDPQSQMNNQITKKLYSKYPETQQIFKYEHKVQNSTFGTINQQEQNYQFDSFQAQNKQNEDLFQNKSSRLNYMNDTFIDEYELTKNQNFEQHSNLRVKDFSNLLIKNVQQQDQAKDTDSNEIKQKNGISKMKFRKYLQSQNRTLHTADGQINPRRSKTPHYLQQQQYHLEPESILQITPMSNQINQDKKNLGSLYQAISQKDEQNKNNQNIPQSAIILYQRNQQQKLQQLSKGSKALNGLLMQQNERQFIQPSLFIKRQNQLKKILQELNNRKALVIDESKIKQMIQNENFEQLLENPNQIIESIRMKKRIDIEEQNFKQNDHPLETVSILSITQNKDFLDENIQPLYLKKNFIPSPVSTITEILSGVGRTQIISKRNQSNESRSNESVNMKRNKIDKIQKIISNTANNHYYQYNQDVGDVIHNYQVNKNQEHS